MFQDRTNAPTVQSVERAFAILRALAAGAAGVSEIAIRTRLPKSTVARLLTTLQELGAVVQIEPLGVYSLGELLVDLAAATIPTQNLVTTARPLLVELVDQTGEAAGLSVLDGPRVHYLDQVDGDHEVQVRDWTGERIDAHVVSSGLVLIASAAPDVRERFLAGEHAAWTDHSVTDRTSIAHRLDDVRRAGFAWVYEEMAEGLNSVAAPVVNAAGVVVAAVHVHGPSYRFPAPGAAASVAALVVDAAKRISERLGRRHDLAANLG